MSAERRRFNLSLWAIEHPALTGYLALALIVLGFAAYFQLPQDEDPPFVYRVMAVRTYWPGATARQVAEQVTDRVERVLQEVPYAHSIRSYSKPGESQIIFIIRDSSRPADVPDIWYTVRKRIGDVRATLPAGVVGPFFNDEFGDVYGVIYAIESDGSFSWAELKDVADHARQSLLRVPDVARVELFGAQEEKLFVEISQTRLSRFGLDLQQVLGQFAQQNAITSTGNLQTLSELVQVRVAGQFETVEQLSAMPIRGSSGNQLRLADIATVRRGYVDPPQVKVRHQGKEVIALGVSMAKGGDIVRLGRELRHAATTIDAALPAGMKLVQVQDQPRAVSTSVNEFVRVLVEAIVIVLAVSFVTLGLRRRAGVQGLASWRRWSIDIRPGLVVAATIPLVLAITFLAMYYAGIGLHKISLGSLIIALGLLVDDAIIAVEMMVRKMEEGYDRVRAATFAYEITAMPMLTGTLITAAGFLPIGMARSTVGEYTFAIFGVTAAALVISWLASVYFVPYLSTRILKSAGARRDAVQVEEHFDTPFYRVFRRWVEACVQYRWVTIGVTLLSFGLGIAGMGRVQQQFFPDSSRPEIMLELWSPEGTTFQANEDVARRVEQKLLQWPGVAAVSTWVGSGVPRFYLPLEQIFSQSNVSQLIVLPHDLAQRERLRRELPALLASEFPEVRSRLKLLPNGPPVAYPVQFRVMGPDPERLRTMADEVKSVVRANANMRGVNDNWNEAIKSMRLEVDQAKARALGVSSQGIADALRVATVGVPVGHYRENDKQIEVVLRQGRGASGTTGDLAQVHVPTSSGISVPLTQVARPVFAWEPGVLWREGRSYAITVQGDIVDGIQAATVTAQLLPALREIESRWPVGYSIKVAGTVEESGKGSSSIAIGVPVMLFITFTLLMLQLHSFSRALLVFLMGPLGIAGVAAALLVLNRPFGFVALLGVIALMGMIQRNAVILIDQIEQDRRRGVPAWDAVVESAVRRLRPIVLTALAAVLAMIPLSRSVFWGPMAVAIMGGLIVATVLTLFALPAMYAAWFRVRREPRPMDRNVRSPLATPA